MQGLGEAEVHELRSHLNDLSRDNAILKRAVAIQNNRLQVGCFVQTLRGVIGQEHFSAQCIPCMHCAVCCVMPSLKQHHPTWTLLTCASRWISSRAWLWCLEGCLRRCGLLQEAVQTKDSELAALRSALQQYEQKVKALELTNYSLSMHLRQATEAHSFSLGQRPPDVY